MNTRLPESEIELNEIPFKFYFAWEVEGFAIWGKIDKSN